MLLLLRGRRRSGRRPRPDAPVEPTGVAVIAVDAARRKQHHHLRRRQRHAVPRRRRCRSGRVRRRRRGLPLPRGQPRNGGGRGPRGARRRRHRPAEPLAVRGDQPGAGGTGGRPAGQRPRGVAVPWFRGDRFRARAGRRDAGCRSGRRRLGPDPRTLRRARAAAGPGHPWRRTVQWSWTRRRPGRRSRGFAPTTVKAVDTTGAGDAFTGAVAARLAAGDPLAAAAAFASVAAALAATRKGTQAAYPGTADVERLLAGA